MATVSELCSSSSDGIRKLATLACNRKDALHDIRVVSEDVLNRSVGDAIAELREARARIPDRDAHLSSIDSVLVPLMQLLMMDVIGPLDV
jgi:hypothetical protein